MSPQKIASIAFFLFVLLQTPCFIIPGLEDEPVPVSPLQLSVSYAIQNWPDTREYLRPWLVPGTWIREAVVPYIRCRVVLDRQQCIHLEGELLNFKDLEPLMEPEAILGVFDHNIKKHAMEIIVGSGVVSIGGLLSAIIPVRLSLLGFALMLWGIIQEQRVPLPPFFLMAVLVTFSIFASDTQKRDTKRQRKLRQQQRAAEPAAADAGQASGSGETKKDQ